MNTRAIATLSLSALIGVGGITGGFVVGQAAASSRDPAADARQAARDAAIAAQALASGRHDQAVAASEAAVALSPRLAEYRVLLGQSYFKAGRFASARQAFADALTLAPDNGKAALNLVLAEIGLGDWAKARTDLDAHAGVIPVADRGLALALAGDPAGAVDLLMAAARTPGATMTTRQNLALAFALAGHWPEARSIAAMDLAPADVNARMEQWAAFAQPRSASDQVAALLGVRPVVDGGQPVALALVAPAPVQVSKPIAAEVTPPLAPAATEPLVASPVLRFAPPSPVVQRLPMSAQPIAKPVAAVVPTKSRPMARVVTVTPAKARPIAAMVATAPIAAPARAVPLAKGDWYVQLGAYENAAVAHDGWARVTRMEPRWRSQIPNAVTYKGAHGEIVRLSIGGLARADADSACRSYRAKGGACFVRAKAGDQVASWTGHNAQVAAR